jgi:ATP-dependent DNA helicase 2 subunit 2
LELKVGTKEEARIGITVFSLDTENDLNDEMGTYEHITALQSIDVPTLDLVRSLSKVEASSLAGDFVDGMVVSLDLLHKRTAKKKYSKRIILLTDAASEIEGAEDIQQIIDQIKEMDVILQILYVAMCLAGNYFDGCCLPLQCSKLF